VLPCLAHELEQSADLASDSISDEKSQVMLAPETTLDLPCSVIERSELGRKLGGSEGK
jgi:hypothetical protein